jgi:hypothetical protein
LLLHPWLSVTLLALALLLFAALFALPQLPAQLRDEPGGPARWFTAVASRRGSWGNLLAGLGLLDVMHSPLLWLLLLVAASALAAQLAEAIAALRQIARWRKLAAAPAPTDATVNEAHGPARVRRQVDVPLSAAELKAVMVGYAGTHFHRVTHFEPDGRLFACVLHPTGLQVRVLLPAGLLVATGGVLAALLLGWQSTLPLLPPGAVYRDGAHNLQIVHSPPAGKDDSTLVVRSGSREAVIRPRPGGDYAIARTMLHVRGYRPGLWLTTTPAIGEAAIATGLACEAPGEEESLLVPAVGAGLRIICGDGTPEFRVELYQSDSVAPVFAAEVLAGQQLTVPVTGDLGLVLTTVPALAVSVTSFPQLWIAWLGIVVALVGLAGHVRPVGHALVQIVVQDAAHSTLRVQADSDATAQAIVEHATAAVAVPARQVELPEPTP